jgi:hypothetical protein
MGISNYKNIFSNLFYRMIDGGNEFRKEKRIFREIENIV